MFNKVRVLWTVRNADLSPAFGEDVNTQYEEQALQACWCDRTRRGDYIIRTPEEAKGVVALFRKSLGEILTNMPVILEGNASEAFMEKHYASVQNAYRSGRLMAYTAPIDRLIATRTQVHRARKGRVFGKISGCDFGPV